MPSRRNVLKGIMGWSGLYATRTLLPGMATMAPNDCIAPDRTLNVVLHGLFVMNVTKTEIQLLTPQIDEHIYRAGNWSKSYMCLDKGTRRYSLKGVQPDLPVPTLSPDSNILLSQCELGFTVDSSKAYITINLPFPQEVRFLRGMKGPNLYKDNRPNPKKPVCATTLALCPVLIYPACDDVRLEDSNHEKLSWKPWWYKGPDYEDGSYEGSMGDIANLHLWAEPETRTSSGHARRAFKKLMYLLPYLDFEPAYDDSPPLDVETRVSGLPPEQEQGWSEWESDGEGSRVTNCNTVGTTG